MIDVQKALTTAIPDEEVEFNQRDVIIYALGVGASDLRFVYENDENFATLPSYPVVLSFKGTSFDVIPFGNKLDKPGIEGFDPNLVLHGEQVVEIFKPIPTSARWIARQKILGVYDKVKGVVVALETKYVDDQGDVVVRCVSSTFMRGVGGFGGPRGPAGGEQVVKIPARAPDAVEETATSPLQATIYRLSSDYNPLHIDPKVAQIAGFKEPILHGLCGFGIATRAIVKHFCANDPKNFKSIKVRFVNPMYPGETLVTEMWREADNKIIFQVKIKERNLVSISNAISEIAPGIPQAVVTKSEAIPSKL